MEPEGSIVHLQALATWPYPEPHQSCPLPPYNFLKTYFTIMLLSVPGSSKRLFSSGLCSKTLSTLLFLPHMCYMARPSLSSLFDNPKDICWETDRKAPIYVVFSTPLLPRPSWAQIFSAAPYSQTFLAFNFSIVHSVHFDMLKLW
jgi:hypothetical protein